MDLIELHMHSYFSFLDALASPEDLVLRAKELGYSALALTDHGGMFGIPRFLRAASSAGIKPIIGCELYVSPTTRADRSPDLRPVGHHLTLLAETPEGYANLAKLSSIGYGEGFFYRPRIDRETLAAHSKGLILLTGCIHSALSECILKQDLKGADGILGFYVEVFGRDRVYVEIQRHGLEEEETLLEKLSVLAKKYRLSRVATNDVHYLSPDDSETHQIAMDMRSRKLPTDPRRTRFSKQAYGLLRMEQWSDLFKKEYADVFETAKAIAARCDVKPDDIRLREGVGNASASARLKEVVEKEISRRGTLTPDQKKRASEELAGLQTAGLSQYFLTIYSLVSESKRQGITIGPGRGSAAGSLIAYLLGITEVDPCEYGLSFERFLSPSRKTLPDVDLDVDFRERDRVIQILQELDPSARTFRAGTVSSIGLKSSIREIARGRGLSYKEVDEKIHSLPSHITKMEPEDRPPWKELVPMINILAPLPKSSMGHPTAMIALPASLEPLLPIYKSQDGSTWLQYDSNDLDWMRIPKLDILPLKVLSVMAETLRWLKIAGVADIHLKSASVHSIPLGDPETYDLLSRGETVGIFQLESSGMRQLLRDLSPNSITSLAAALALYRPGPLEADLPRIYMERKNGREPPAPPHALFEPILRETHGLILYQEQVMSCARCLGMTTVEADDFRIAVSKKNEESMKRACDRFEKALRAAGLSEKDSAALVSQITHHAAFSFNKAHAISYAILSYRAAYLKCHYPGAFLASSANVSLDDRGQLGEIFSEARRLGIRILPPDIMTVGAECVSDPDGKKIRLGLSLIRHLPENVIADILRCRPFSDVPDLLMKVPGLLNHQAMEMLCKSGALDEFGQDRKKMMASLPTWIDRIKKSSKQSGFQSDLFGESSDKVSGGPEQVPSESPTRGTLLLEYESLGFFATGSPMDDIQEIVSEFCSGRLGELVSRASSASAVHPKSSSPVVTAAGLLMSLRAHIDRQGREMAFAKIEDATDSLDVVLFHDVFVKNKSLLVPGSPLLVSGRLEKRGVSVTLLADVIVEIDKPERLYESILLKFDEGIGIEVMRKIKDILKDHLGDRPVHLEMTEGGSTYEFRVGWSCRPSTDLRRKLESILGLYSVFFLKSTVPADRR